MTWCKLADLLPEQHVRILSVRPKRRTYLLQADAGYDWAAGQPFVVISDCVFRGYTVAVDEKANLKDHGFTHVHIHYNDNAPHLELEL